MQTQTIEHTQPHIALPSFSASRLSRLAVQALRSEAELTPKPGLVDRRGPGAHHDLNLELMLASADSLSRGFEAMAEASQGARPSLALRERLGALGRSAEANMLHVTGGVNTHRGAIWTLGLLISGCAAAGAENSLGDIVSFAAQLAAMPDRFSDGCESHGAYVLRTFGAGGARQEARDGFPHVVRHGLPALHHALDAGATREQAQHLSLLALMATLDDTCLLYRAGPNLLQSTRSLSARAHQLGGLRTPAGRACVQKLDDLLLASWASPGGSADLLAATIFLDAFLSEPSPTTFDREEAALCRN